MLFFQWSLLNWKLHFCKYYFNDILNDVLERSNEIIKRPYMEKDSEVKCSIKSDIKKNKMAWKSSCILVQFSMNEVADGLAFMET